MEQQSGSARDFLNKLYIALADMQHALGKPSIAAVGGAARAGGMTLSISCNVIVAGRSATIGYPEIDVGIITGNHLIHIPAIVRAEEQTSEQQSIMRITDADCGLKKKRKEKHDKRRRNKKQKRKRRK